MLYIDKTKFCVIITVIQIKHGIDDMKSKMHNTSNRQNSAEESGHSFKSYFKRMTSPLLVLSILRERPMYCYELSTEIKKRSSGRLAVSVLYPVLYRMEEQGYIEIAKTEVIDGRARSYYQVTADGEEYLKKTLAEYRELSEIFSRLIY